jgi:hypothetical protein
MHDAQWIIYLWLGYGYQQLTICMGASRTGNTSLVSCRFASEEVIYTSKTTNHNVLTPSAQLRTGWVVSRAHYG